MSGWKFVGASAIGAAHVKQETECQDRFACEEFAAKGEKILLAVVADGAGSSSDGQTGAETACRLFIEIAKDFLSSQDARVKSLNADFGKYWLSFVRQKIAEIAENEKKQARDFASTLIGAAVGENEAVFFQIGDGAAVISPTGEPQSYRFAVAPTESEYVNVTEFITDDDAEKHLRVELIEEKVKDLILFSDGIFGVAVDFQKNQPHEPFLAPMLAPLRNGNSLEGLSEKLEAFLSSPKINEKTDDDKTIILASRS